jgi:hypothetical protein
MIQDKWVQWDLNLAGKWHQAFTLVGTKVVVTHKLNLELLKRINDIDYVVSIKAAPYSAGASSDF